MDSDAFASFVSVDMELQEPLFEIGLIAGTLYADVEDSPGSEAPARPRHFRHSLEVLKRAVQVWNQCGERLAFVAHLGDALAAENAQAEAQWSALHTFDEERGRCVCKQWHLVPGEHDLRCFGATQLGAALMPCHKGEEAYYSFSPAKGWRVLVLDAYDVSLLANAPESDAHAAALGLVQQQNPNLPDAADALARLEGVARRWGYSGGGLGAVQLAWLGGQLNAAEAASGARHLVTLPCSGGYPLPGYRSSPVQPALASSAQLGFTPPAPSTRARHPRPAPAHPPVPSPTQPAWPAPCRAHHAARTVPLWPADGIPWSALRQTASSCCATRVASREL